MSSPVRAVARQWTLRRSSPLRYSADADVVLTVHGDGPAGALAATALPARGAAGAERPHPGDDEQHGAVGADGVALDEPEGVHQPQPQRTEDVPAATSPVDAVAERRRRPGRQPVDDEPRRAAQVGGQRLGEPPQAARPGRRRW